MIPDIPIVIIGVLLAIVNAVFGTMATALNSIPGPLSLISPANIQTAIVFFLSPIWYFQGIIPVPAVLNFLGAILAFLTAMFLVYLFEWIWGHFH